MFEGESKGKPIDRRRRSLGGEHGNSSSGSNSHSSRTSNQLLE